MRARGIILAIGVLFALSATQLARADGPPSYRQHCHSIGADIDRVICQNIALRVDYARFLSAVDEMRAFYFGDEAAEGRPKVYAMLENARREWVQDCDVSSVVVTSKLTSSCLVDRINYAYFTVRCPLIISLYGKPPAELQQAWGDRNKDFCLREAPTYFGTEN